MSLEIVVVAAAVCSSRSSTEESLADREEILVAIEIDSIVDDEDIDASMTDWRKHCKRRDVRDRSIGKERLPVHPSDIEIAHR